jgi:enterochelin esterase-like enzyme
MICLVKIHFSREARADGIPFQITIFGAMPIEKSRNILRESMSLRSNYLEREVQVDCYLPAGMPPDFSDVSLLLFNDGQDLDRMGMAGILNDLYGRGRLRPLLCIGIYAGADRKMEYGTAGRPDHQGWGARADGYTRFIFEELLPAIRERYRASSFREKAFAGFSLGALSAMDIVWRHPEEFARAGLFSGSFWWRTRSKDDPAFNEATDRIMHEEVRRGGYYPWLKFFFECGTQDESEDRNHNGIIDSIDDVRDLMGELAAKGYDPASDIRYVEIAGGRHDVETWARAMPEFLLWGWGK